MAVNHRGTGSGHGATAVDVQMACKRLGSKFAQLACRLHSEVLHTPVGAVDALKHGLKLHNTRPVGRLSCVRGTAGVAGAMYALSCLDNQTGPPLCTHPELALVVLTVLQLVCFPNIKGSRGAIAFAGLHATTRSVDGARRGQR